MDPKKARICELEFLELCTRLISYRNNPTDISTFLKSMDVLIDFNPRIMAELSRDIFNIKYKPYKEEIVQILHEKGYTLREIGKVYNKSISTLSDWVQKELVLFPRCTSEQQTEVVKFMDQYNKLFTSNLINIL